MREHFLKAADIMLPAEEIDLQTFSVVACDQYTSEPEYWERVLNKAEGKPSACHMIFPEIYLEQADFESRIEAINSTMRNYLSDGVFEEHPDTMIYLERTLRNGTVRRGLVGMIDLEQYDYQKGTANYIRATEGTVLERIPPRVAIRKDAALEFPHIMLLVDDAERKLIEPLSDKKQELQPLYRFELMENSGSMEGYAVTGEERGRIAEVLEEMGSGEVFCEKYGVSNQLPMLFAVGDGNHSLATAKSCYEALKKTLSPEEAKNHPARYALVEVVNLHDESLEFEAIHRVLFQVDGKHLLEELKRRCNTVSGENPQTLTAVFGGNCEEITLYDSPFQLTVGTLQHFLDEYLQEFGGKIDYIHGEDVVHKLCKESETVGFLLPCMDKSELFPTVILDGALPRKTFSMGEACDKRFYLEGRRIQK